MKEFLAICVLIFSLAACSDDPSGPATGDRSIEGVALNAADNNPIENVHIYARDSKDRLIDSAISNEYGEFSLQRLPGDFGRVSISASHSEFMGFAAPLDELAEDLDTNQLIRVRMSRGYPCSGKLVVRTVDSITQRPISLINLTLNSSEEFRRYKGITDSAGYARFGNFCPGEYSIFVRVPAGGNSYNKSIQMNFDKDSNYAEIPVTVPAPEDSCLIYFTIEAFDKETGNPIEEMKIQGMRDGQVTLSNDLRENIWQWYFYSPAEFNFIIKSPDHITYESDTYEADCGDTIRIKAYLEKTFKARVMLEVYDEEPGAPLDGIGIKIFENGEIVTPAFIERMDPGLYKLEFRKTGDYQISIYKDGYNKNIFDLAINDDDYIKLRKYLKRVLCNEKFTLKLIHSETGEKISEGYAIIESIYGNYRNTKYPQNGEIEFMELCPELYSLTYKHSIYKTITRVISPETMQSQTWEVEINDSLCCDGGLRLNVVDTLTMQNVAIANLKIYYKEQKVYDNTSDVNFVIDNLCAIREYDIIISATGYEEYRFSLDMPDCEVFYKNIYLTPK